KSGNSLATQPGRPAFRFAPCGLLAARGRGTRLIFFLPSRPVGLAIAIRQRQRAARSVPENHTGPPGSLAVLSHLAAHLSPPTPLASLVSGLLMLALLAALYTTFDWLRGRREPGKRSIADGVINGLRWLDRVLVHVGSWLVGTRIADPALRPTVVVSVFSGFALAGAPGPSPWGLAALAAGVFFLLLLFRPRVRPAGQA